MTEQQQEGMLPKAKLQAVAMLNTLASNIQANIPYTRRQPDIVFPPPSWNVEELERREDAKEEPKEEAKEEAKEEPTQPTTQPNEETTAAPPQTSTDKPENPPEPMTFAQKLKEMIESLPVPPAVTSTVTSAIETASASIKSKTSPVAGVDKGKGKAKAEEEEEVEDPPLPPIDGDGPPLPENVDPETLRYLSSRSVMTGAANGAATPSAKQSVWAALEKMKPPYWVSGTTAATGDGKEAEKKTGPEAGGGVMISAPLLPDDSSEIELADCVTPSSSGEKSAGDKDTKGKSKETTTKPSSPAPASEQPKIWVPSTTTLSIYTTWWGYRIYIPPPVMAQLDSGQMRATKRATVITTFLQWVLTRVPTMVVPPQMRGALVMLKRLTPVISYIGVFIAWSWQRIQAMDEGNGVVLTATWLVPVALIPTKWDAGDIFGPMTKPEEVVVDEAERNKGKGKEQEKKQEKKGFVARLNPFGGWGKK